MPHALRCALIGISIHALLAESDVLLFWAYNIASAFLSTLSLRRATFARCRYWALSNISIHALLAESDGRAFLARPFLLQFLSTLSLRRATTSFSTSIVSVTAFLSTLSLRRATWNSLPVTTPHWNFYPRSPCGERHCDVSCY